MELSTVSTARISVTAVWQPLRITAIGMSITADLGFTPPRAPEKLTCEDEEIVVFSAPNASGTDDLHFYAIAGPDGDVPIMTELAKIERNQTLDLQLRAGAGEIMSLILLACSDATVGPSVPVRATTSSWDLTEDNVRALTTFREAIQPRIRMS